MLNKLELSRSFTSLSDEVMPSIREGSYITYFAENYCEYKEIIKDSEIYEISNEKLIEFFEKVLITLSKCYGTRMDKYTEAEGYYELAKQEILMRFRRLRHN